MERCAVPERYRKKVNGDALNKRRRGRYTTDGRSHLPSRAVIITRTVQEKLNVF